MAYLYNLNLLHLDFKSGFGFTYKNKGRLTPLLFRNRVQ